jgi:hypothetical protein
MTSEAEEQRERRETLLQDADLRRRQSQGSTYLDAHHSELGGRFGSLETETVTGRPSPQPPPLPANSPWAGPDVVPREPPLGYRIDQMPEHDPPTDDHAVRDPGGAADAPSGSSLFTDVEHAAPPSSSTDREGDGA